jgi:recombination protein RecA
VAEKVLTVEEFYKKLGKEDKDALISLKDRKPIEFIPTGSWVINSIIGDGTMTGKPGGFPRGHIVEVFGDESAGKTTLAISVIKQAQELGGFGVLMDFEQTFHPGYAQKIGVNLDKNKFIVMQPSHFQHGARLIKDCLLMKPHIIVVDSVSAMLPQQFLEGAVDEAGRIGLQAQLMSAFLGYISKFLKDSNTCLCFTNQLRSVIKKSKYDTGPDEESSGGRALKYYASVRLKLKKSTVEKVNVKSKITGKADKEPVNVMIKASVVKNKVDKPYMAAPVYIRFGEGFDNIISIIELAINTNVIKKSGAFYTFANAGSVIVKAQGKEQLRKMFDENNEAYALLTNSLVLKEDEQAKEEYKDVDQDSAPDEMDDLLSNVAETYIDTKKARNAKKEEDDG